MAKRWTYQDAPSPDLIKALSQSLGVEEALATLLVQRGVQTFEEAETFFRPDLAQLHDPFLMAGMREAVERLEKSIHQQEKVLIYGDYDVDGTTAVAMLYRFLQPYLPNLHFYIPDRHQEGYGISHQAVQWAQSENFKLIIALDCGIKAVAQVNAAKMAGIDVIICDHHLPSDTLPSAHAILNPKQTHCHYPFKELSGCGIGFKFLQGFCQKKKIDLKLLYAHLDLVVVSIAADMVPMVGENRTLAYFGLKKINHSPRPGLKALIDTSGLRQTASLDIRNLVFVISPRINAVGRLQHAHQAVSLLAANDSSSAEQFATDLNQINRQRKDLDHHCTEEALEMIAQQEQEDGKHKSTVLYAPHWHKGILGIVAARCIEHYYRPTVILSQDGIDKEQAVGSARSIQNFDLYQAIQDCGDLLTRYGGHRYAAGISLPVKNIPAFRARLEEIAQQRISSTQMIPTQEVDLKIHLDQLDDKFYRILRQFAPFGPHNMRPVFVSEQLIWEDVRVLKEKHLKLRVQQREGQARFPVIAFGMADQYSALLQSKSLDLCYCIEENHYQGKKTLQLIAKDFKFN